MTTGGYRLIPESEVRALAPTMGLNLDTGNNFQLWAPPYDKTPSLTVTEKPLEFDEYGHFLEWQERDVGYLVEHFSAMVVNQGYDDFLALPGLYQDDSPGNHFFKWLRHINFTLHPKYSEFMRGICVSYDFNGGIRFHAEDFHRFLEVSAESCFGFSDDIYIISLNKPCLFYVWNHSAIMVFPRTQIIYGQIRQAIPRFGLHLVDWFGDATPDSDDEQEREEKDRDE